MVFWTSLTATIVSLVHGTSVGAFGWQLPVGLALILIPSSYLGGVLGAKALHYVDLRMLRIIYVLSMTVLGLKILFF
jgi:uncharacterized membrane protein YfcA